MSMQAAKQFAIQQGNLLNKMSMTEFFTQIHSQFYSDQDISFMEYFLELTDHDGEFYVEHTKLKEYGIMTSKRSSTVLEKLQNLGLLIDVDYLLQDILQQHESGTKHSKIYYLTPDGFKKCLMRARKYTGQDADPVIYCDYYLLLEKIFKLYRDYESAYDKKMLSIKDDKIESLSKKIDAEREEAAKEREEAAKEREEAANERKAAETRHCQSMEQMKRMRLKLEENGIVAEETLEIVGDIRAEIRKSKQEQDHDSKSFLHRWVAPLLYGEQLHKLGDQINSMKCLFALCFWMEYEEPVEIDNLNANEDADPLLSYGKMYIYISCSNLSGISNRIRKLQDRHCSREKDETKDIDEFCRMSMLRPMVIGLFDVEVNQELRILNGLSSHLNTDDYSCDFRNIRKRYDIDFTQEEISLDYGKEIFYDFVDFVANSRIHSYQLSLTQEAASNKRFFTEKLLEGMGLYDSTYLKQAREYLSIFVKSYVKVPNGSKFLSKYPYIYYYYDGLKDMPKCICKCKVCSKDLIKCRCEDKHTCKCKFATYSEKTLATLRNRLTKRKESKQSLLVYMQDQRSIDFLQNLRDDGYYTTRQDRALAKLNRIESEMEDMIEDQ